MAEGDLDFFVSYTQADRAWAEWIAWQLEDEGYRVLIQAWDMVPGSNWTHRMHDGVRRATRTVVVLSPAYTESVCATAEWGAAWRDDPLGEYRKLLVFRVADCLRPGLLGGVVSQDLFGVSKVEARARIISAAQSGPTGRAKPAAEPGFPPERRAARSEPQFPGALPGVWNVPLRNSNFTGRADELGLLRECLDGHSVVTVNGMGGIGKTQTVTEYAHKYAADYDLAWWINAEKVALIGDQLMRLGMELGLPHLDDPEATLATVYQALRSRNRWLLVFDNATSAQEIASLLPSGAGHVLITTRRDGFRHLGGVLNLDILHRADAVTLLCLHSTTLTKIQANELAERLGDLPLALEQAAGYLDQTGMPAQQYLRLLDTRSADLHTRGYTSGHPDNIATIWSVSTGQLRLTAPAVIQLLELCAWLAPEPIPLDLFTGHSQQLPEPLASVAADPVTFADAVAVLTGYSLARRSGDTLIVHRLIQDVTRDQLPLGADSLSSILGAAVKILTEVTATLERPWENAVEARRLAQHAIALAGNLGEDRDLTIGVTAADLLPLRIRAVKLLDELGDSTGQMIAIGLPLAGDCERILGQDNPLTLDALKTLASAYRQAGRVTEAIPIHLQVLAACERVLGSDDPQTLSARNALAVAYQVADRMADAIPIHEQVLVTCERVLGPDDPQTLGARDNLAIALRQVGKAAQAISLHEQALAAFERILGPDHPETLGTKNNLAIAYREAGRVAEAIPLHQQVLADRDRVFALNHPQTLTARNALAETYQMAGKPAERIPLFEKVLTACQQTFGPNHPDLSPALINLGSAQLQMGQLENAHASIERALKISRKAYGPNHTKVVPALISLGAVQVRMAQLPEALDNLKHALEIIQQAQNPDRSMMTSVLFNLSAVYFQNRQLDEAFTHIERTLEISEELHGADHRKIAPVLITLGAIKLGKGNPQEAHVFLERALGITHEAYGTNHPEVASALINLGAAQLDLGELRQARDNLERALEIAMTAYGADHPECASARIYLGAVQMGFGELTPARDNLERALKINEVACGADHPAVASTLISLSILYFRCGQLEVARKGIERALAIIGKTYAPTHPNAAPALINLGAIQLAQGEAQDACTSIELALTASRNAYGFDHPEDASALINLGAAQLQMRKPRKARKNLKRALSITEKIYGHNHPENISALIYLGAAEIRIGRLRKARINIIDALTTSQAIYGPDYPVDTSALFNIGIVQGGRVTRYLINTIIKNADVKYSSESRTPPTR